MSSKFFSNTDLRKRASAPAFHPEASQEILDLEDSIFGIVRTSLDGNQSIVCLYNFAAKGSAVKAGNMLKKWFPSGSAKDLISGGEIQWGSKAFELRPYQALWLVAL